MATQNQNITKILIAPDKFKGSLTSSQAASAIRRGLEGRNAGICFPANHLGDSAGHAEGAVCAQGAGVGHVADGFCAREGGSDASGNDCGGICSQTGGTGDFGNVCGTICADNREKVCREEGDGGEQLQFRIVEIADGGDGSLEVVEKKVTDGRRVQCEAADPVGVRRQVEYLLYKQEGELAAFIEMAKVCGLAQLDAGLRNPLKTSTYGLGEVILDAVGKGAVSITLSIGGSATDDCGAGMLQALGYVFTDAEGELMPALVCGGDLEKIAAIREPEARQWDNVEVICDVTNPLLGPSGATAVYAPQKGADSDALLKLEVGKASFTKVAEKCLGIAEACKEQPGAGAAGGVGYAGMAFLGAELVPGWRFFARITSLEESVRWADLVITGEGSLDSQSLSGKVVSGVVTLAKEYGKPVMIFCGVNKLGLEDMETLSSQLHGRVEIRSIASLGHPLEVCMRDAAALLEQLAGV